MPLNDKSIQAAKATDKPLKLFDGGGLFLLVNAAGGKWWRLKFRIAGKEKLLSLGTYPEVPLASQKIRIGSKDVYIKGARELRDDARKLIAQGIDPSEERRKEKLETEIDAGNTFSAVTDEWLEKHGKTLAETTKKKNKAIIDNNIRPWLGKRPIKDIKAPEILKAIRRAEDRGANELAHRALRMVGQIFRYAVATGRVDQNPADRLSGALQPVVTKHHPAITDQKALGALLRAIDGYSGTLAVKCALKLAPMLFIRPGELRHAEWSVINLDTAEWRYFITKTKTEHIVPLPKQAVAIFKELQPLTGNGQYVFSSLRSGTRPMSNNTVNAALRRLGYSADEVCGHGFRATARTILDEDLEVRPDFIEHQLAHAVKDPNGRAYNRTAHLAKRREMMQLWADHLDKLRKGADVIPLRTEAA